MKTIQDALASKWSSCLYIQKDFEYSGLTWLDTNTPKPTEDELQAEVARLQAEYDAQAYARSRASEYPPIGDQLDALWKGGEEAAAMLAKVQAVKAKYPKEQA